MVTVRLYGGLGNQMFQYATARAVADRLDTKLCLDTRSFATYDLHSLNIDAFNIRAQKAPDKDLQNAQLIRIMRLVTKFLPLKGWHFERHFGFDDSLVNLTSPVYMDGYYQSPGYFDAIRSQLETDFTLGEPLSESSHQTLLEIENNRSVAIHIRRGDYATDPTTLAKHGLCSDQYYYRAIENLRSRFEDLKFFVFSDEPDAASTLFRNGDDFIYIRGNDNRVEQDIYLMSRCQHHIIANSSFSWWGAYLGQHGQQIVIAPNPWFSDTTINTSDLLPESWIKISRDQQAPTPDHEPISNR